MELVELLKRPVVEWWNSGVDRVVGSSYHRIVESWNGGVSGVITSLDRPIAEWWSYWSCRNVESSKGGMVE